MARNDRFPVGRLALTAVALVLFGGLYFTARAAFDSQPLAGEEGKFAALAAYQPARPQWNFYARVDGEALYGAFQHPAPMYELIRLGGWMASRVVELDGPDPVSTPRLRTFFSLYAFIIWAGLLGLVIWRYPSLGGAVAATLLAGLALSPLAISTSQNLQTDGSVGVLLTGLAALLLLGRSASRQDPPGLAGAAATPRFEPLPDRRELALVALAGAVASLGKQEWSLALLAAAIAWLVLTTVLGALAQREQKPTRHPAGAAPDAAPAGDETSASPADPSFTPAWRRLGLALLVGVLAGNLLSLGYDPREYLDGFAVMQRFSAESTIVTGSLDNWWQVNLSRGTMLIPPLALGAWLIIWGAASLAAAIAQRRLLAAPRVALVGLFGLALLAGYLASSWNAQPRYFAPALVVLAAAVALSVARQPRWPALAATVVVLLLAINLHVAHRAKNPPPEAHHRYLEQIATFSDRLRELIPPEGLAVLPTSLTWNKPELDFINDSISPQRAFEFARERGRQIYVPR